MSLGKVARDHVPLIMGWLSPQPQHHNFLERVSYEPRTCPSERPCCEVAVVSSSQGAAPRPRNALSIVSHDTFSPNGVITV